MRELRSGRYADTTDIARQFQLNDAHVRRILRFGYLAADIDGAIIETKCAHSAGIETLAKPRHLVINDDYLGYAGRAAI